MFSVRNCLHSCTKLLIFSSRDFSSDSIWMLCLGYSSAHYSSQILAASTGPVRFQIPPSAILPPSRSNSRLRRRGTPILVESRHVSGALIASSDRVKREPGKGNPEPFIRRAVCRRMTHPAKTCSEFPGCLGCPRNGKQV
jgi:hypothetical protein